MGMRAGGSHNSTRSRCAGGTGVNRSAGVTGTWPSRAWWGRSALYSATHARRYAPLWTVIFLGTLWRQSGG
jgi:hypothetical protein